MIIPKEMLMRSSEGFEVILSESIETPIIILPPELYDKVKEHMEKEIK